MRIKVFSAALLLLSGLVAVAGLELYCDFEKKESKRTVDLGGLVGSFQGEPGPSYVAVTPDQLKSRSKQSLKLGGGFVFFRQAPDLGENWTVNCFIKPESKAKGFQTLLCRPGGWFYSYNLSSKTVRLIQVGAAENRVEFKLDIQADQWQMLTLVKSGLQVRPFLNGKPAEARELKAELSASGQLYLGASSSTASNPALAVIDDLAIWNTALTDSDIARLFQGVEPASFGVGERIERVATPPFTAANTRIYRPAAAFDASNAVIVPNDRADGMQMAETVQRELEKIWGVKFPIRSVKNHHDGREPLILAGPSMRNPLSRELAANLQIPRPIQGAELRIFPEALDWQRGVIYLGGRNEAEVAKAIAALQERFPTPERLTFTIAPLHEIEKTDPQAAVETARKHFAGRDSRKINLALNTYLMEAFLGYRNTGDDRYVAAFSEILQLIVGLYPQEFAKSSTAPTFEFHLFPQYLYLLENSPAFSDADRIKAAEFTRAVLEQAMDSWELVKPAQSYAMNKLDYYTNHYVFASRTAAAGARYLLSRYQYEPARYFLAVGEHVMDSVRSCPLSPEDASGYQYLVYRIFVDYMLSAGKFDESIFRSPEFREYTEYAKGQINHLGETAGYGDAYATGSYGYFFPLREIDEIIGDEEVQKIMSLLRRNATGSFYVQKLAEWDIPTDLPLIDDPRFDGLTIFTVNPVRQKLLGLNSTKLPKLDKAIFRSSWQPDAEFLAINGLSNSPHGHDDAIGISQYVVGPHFWLFEGDYIRRFVEDHNLVAVIRDGLAPLRQRHRVPDSERYAQIVGQVQNPERNQAILALLLKRYNGVDYHRYICWKHEGGVWVVDRLQANDPGNYRFASYWRTTGKITPQAQGVMVRQKPGPSDRGLTEFSISEGTGAAAFGFAELERTHGRGNRSHNLPYSDAVTKTRIFWKDAPLQTGEKVYFVQYFKALPGGSEPAAIEEIRPGVYAAGEGGSRSVIALADDGIVFTADNATLSIPEGIAAPAADDRGRIIPNSVLPPPAGAAEKQAAALHSFSAPITRIAGGDTALAVGLADGKLHLYDPDGKLLAEKQFPAEISAIGVIPTPQGECFAVGCRPANTSEISPGSLHFIDRTGKELWQQSIMVYHRRTGTPTTIFPAWINGRNQPPVIAAGAESWHYFLFDLSGRELLAKTVTHAATAGAAGDFDGDGKDEFFGGAEYYYHLFFDAAGKDLSRSSTSPWNNAVVAGALPAGSPVRAFAARRDGFLYAESPNAEAKKWSVNLGGPAYGLVLLPDAVAASTLNGYITLVDGDGKRVQSIELPAPLTDLAMKAELLYAPGLDGRVYAVDPATGRAVSVTQCAAMTGEERFFPQLETAGKAVFAAFGNQLFLIGK